MTAHFSARSLRALYSNPLVSWPVARTRSTQNNACCSTTEARTCSSDVPLVTCQPIMLEMKGPTTKPSTRANTTGLISSHLLFAVSKIPKAISYELMVREQGMPALPACQTAGPRLGALISSERTIQIFRIDACHSESTTSMGGDQSDISRMTSESVVIGPPFHHQRNCIPSTAIR